MAIPFTQYAGFLEASGMFREKNDILDRLTPDEQQKLKQARTLAIWMDERFKIGGFGIGLDGIVGFIPVFGDLFTGAFGLYHLYIAAQLRLDASVLASIVVNTLADIFVGFIPGLGDAIDFLYRSHRRNLKLIERKLEERLEAAG